MQHLRSKRAPSSYYKNAVQNNMAVECWQVAPWSDSGGHKTSWDAHGHWEEPGQRGSCWATSKKLAVAVPRTWECDDGRVRRSQAMWHSDSGRGYGTTGHAGSQNNQWSWQNPQSERVEEVWQSWDQHGAESPSSRKLSDESMQQGHNKPQASQKSQAASKTCGAIGNGSHALRLLVRTLKSVGEHAGEVDKAPQEAGSSPKRTQPSFQTNNIHVFLPPWSLRCAHSSKQSAWVHWRVDEPKRLSQKRSRKITKSLSHNYCTHGCL